MSHAQQVSEDGMVETEELESKEYVGIIWIGDSPGIRLRVLAPSAPAALALVTEQYGEGHVITLWNEIDAKRPR